MKKRALKIWAKFLAGFATLVSVFAALMLSALVISALVLVSSDSDTTRVLLQGEGEFLLPEGRYTTLAAVNSPPNSDGTGFGWTIVGSIYDPKTELDALAWWEADEDINQWQLNQLDKAIPNSQRFTALATIPEIQVAVGVDGQGLDSKGSAWYRRSQTGWIQSSLENLDQTDELIAVDVAQRNNSIEVLALGRQTIDGKATYQLWTSNDAIGYEKVSLDFAEGTVLTDVAINTLGLVAVGYKEEADGISSGIVWVSSDGTDWRTPQGNFSGENSTILSGVSASDTGFTITGGVRDGTAYIPTAWVSQDINIWSDEGIFFDAGEDDGRLSTAGFLVGGVSATSEGFVAFSSVGFLQQIWRSRDGKAWGEVGYIRGHRDVGIPVSDVALTISPESNSIQSVAITADTGIWIYDSASSWKEVDFRLGSAEILPRIEDGPRVVDVVWDPVSNSFLVAGTFAHAKGESSETTIGARFWRSTNLGKTWTFHDQFHERNLGGPVSDLDVGPRGVVAVGREDESLKASAAAEQDSISNPNSKALFWYIDKAGDWQQSIADLAAEDYPNLNIEFIVPLSRLLAATSTQDGFIVGGLALFGFADNVDGLLFKTKPGSLDHDVAFELIPSENIGLQTEEDDWVTALCRSEPDGATPEKIVLFGANNRDEGPVITSALSIDGGSNWQIGEGVDGAFDEFGSQTVSACTSIPNQTCMHPDSIFKDLEPCNSSDDFFLAVGAIQSQGELDARAWWSSDGNKWEILDLPAELTGAGNQEFTGVIVSGERILFIANDDSLGIARGQLWVEDETLVLLPTGLENSRVDFEFTSGAVNPEGYLVIVGVHDSRLARIWYSIEPIFSD